MELGTSLTIVGTLISLVGIFAIIMRFLSAERGGPDNDVNYTVATREDLHALEERLDKIRKEIGEHIDKGLTRIHEKLDEREKRCSKRGQRIAAVERQLELASPRPPKGADPGIVGFRRRKSDPQVSPEEEKRHPYTSGEWAGTRLERETDG